MSAPSTQKFSLWTLTAMVVGSMVGAGIFSLPQTFGRVTGILGSLIAWTISGIGMLMLALVFQNLAQRKPDLDAGVYAYAKAGFGNYWGFASMAIMTSALVAGALAAVLQPQAVLQLVNEPVLATPLAYIKGIWSALATGFRMTSGISEVDRLLSRGGMSSMLKTLWIVIGAVTFGTLLEEFNLIAKLVNPVLTRARTTGRLILTVVATAIGLNIVTADQYIALVLPVRMFRAEFQNRGLKAQNLSRVCADAGTVTSPLVPWNSCGAYMAVTLGVPTLLYLPFCFFNIAAPLVSLFLGFTGFKIERLQPSRVSPEPVPTR